MTDNDPALTAAWNHGYWAGWEDQQARIDRALRLENKPGAHKEHLIEALRPELTPEQQLERGIITVDRYRQKIGLPTLTEDQLAAYKRDTQQETKHE